MPLPKIDSVKIQTDIKQNNTVQTVQKKQNNDELQDKPKSKTAQYMIGATALAATIAIGVIGHKNNWWHNKELSIDAFKKAGNKFVKGKALTSKDKLFSGKITIEKSFKKYVLEYENGCLIKSTKHSQKFDGTNQWYQDSVKEYENGKLVKQTTKYCTTKYVYDEKTGKIIKNVRVGDDGRESLAKGFYYTKDGKLKYLYNGADIERFRTFTEFYEGTNKVKNKYIFEQPKHVQMFDKDGNLVTDIHESLKFGFDLKEYHLGYNRTQPFSLTGTHLRISDKDCSIEHSVHPEKFGSYADIDEFIVQGYNKTTKSPFYINILTSKRTPAALEFYKKCPEENFPRKISIKNEELGKMSFNVNEPLAEIELKTGEKVIYNRKTAEIQIPEGCTAKPEDIKKIVDEFTEIGKLLKQKVREHKLYHMDEYYNFTNKVHQASDMDNLPHFE